MFFIFGSARSGTTLLASTLSQHSSLIVPRETDFIVPLLLILDRVPKEQIARSLITELICSTRYFPVSIGAHLSRKEIADVIAQAKYTAADILADLYATLAKKAGKRCGGDKSPNDLSQISIFLKSGILASPRVKVVHIVRDIRDVALSLLNVEWGGKDAAKYAPHDWATNNLLLHKACASDSGKYLLVRYEDIVSDPEAAFRKMTAFLGYPFEPAMLDHCNRGMEYRHMAHHQHLGDPFFTDRIGVGCRELPQDLLSHCQEHAAEAMTVFGYRQWPDAQGVA